MHPNPKKIIPIVLVIALGAVLIWYFTSTRVAAQNQELSAAGTVEATQVIVAPEIGGKVETVLVNEGDSVRSGQELARFEDQLLAAQLSQAEAALAVAQANYDLVAAGMPSEQRQLAVAAAELEILQAEQAIDSLNDHADLAAAMALQAMATADKQLDQAGKRVDNLNTASNPADIDAARAAVTLTKDRLDKAHEKFAPYEKKPDDNVVRAILLNEMSDAQKKYDAAVTRLNNLLGDANELELSIADANRVLVQAQLDDARRQYAELKDGPDPDALALAEGRLAAAQAKLKAARAEPTPEQLALAEAQIEAAQAAMGIIAAQMEKLVVRASVDGTVLSRNIEPGEIAMPGAVLMTLARLDDLTITVFVPEDRYGLISRGQTAELTTDSFPGKVFDAIVVEIADQAEFTPRNVQTSEGRRSTVFAVKLAVQDEQGRLIPGMPADVLFGE